MRSLLGLALFAACSAQTPALPCAGQESCLYGQATVTYDVNPIRGYDLLVVMDDSASMAARQEELVAKLAPELKKVPGGLPELRVKVVSSSVPAPGLAAFPGCATSSPVPACTPAAGYLLATQLCGQQSNYSGDFADAFRCTNRLGSAGCGWEQPLAAARAALEGDPGDGSRFLRKDAFLVLLIISDEDDCSVPPGSPLFGAPTTAPDDPALAYRCHEAGIRCGGRRLSELPVGTDLADCAAVADGGGLVPVDDYVQFFRGLKARPDQQVLVSLLAGWPDRYGLVGGAEPQVRPACVLDGNPVLPALRLRALMEAFGASGQLIDLCSTKTPVDAALKPIGERLARNLGKLCLPRNLLDRDPAQAGVQPSCVASEGMVDQTSGAVRDQRPLPACETGAAPPCWRTRDEEYCLTAEIDRGGCLAPGGTEITFRCAIDPSAPEQ